MTVATIPRAFVWRRLHSLMGLWLVLFLIEHLLVNSQAALLLGESGQGFVEMVNSIHNLPYLEFLEIFLLGVPILIHLVWGVKYLLTAKSNAHRSDGSKPALAQYGRNRAYSWQRITSWILLVGLVAHIVNFRFLNYPETVHQGKDSYYFVRLHLDDGLYTVSSRLGATLYDVKAIEEQKRELEHRSGEQALLETASMLREGSQKGFLEAGEGTSYDSQKEVILTSAQKFEEKLAWVKGLQARPLSAGEVIAVCDNFGTASLLTVRDSFKNPVHVVLYTIFVLAACFHAFNGLWTFLITWGLILKMSAQRSMVTFAIGLMLLITLLGLIAIWGTYWLNLRY